MADTSTTSKHSPSNSIQNISNNSNSNTSDQTPKRETTTSLLGKALAVPSGLPPQPPPTTAYMPQSPANDTSNTNNSSPKLEHDLIIPIHSDMTIPTRNFLENVASSPPQEASDQEQRRSMFGSNVNKKYVKFRQQELRTATTKSASTTTSAEAIEDILPIEVAKQNSLSSTMSHTDGESITSSIDGENEIVLSHTHDRTVSELTPPPSPSGRNEGNNISFVSPLTPHDRDIMSRLSKPKKHHHHQTKELKAHETVHAQSFFLGLAFMAVWSPQNCLAPNLTEMADQFGFSEAERDIYLGANIALATGVLSLPISAGIGILADLCNRKYLFLGTVLCGSLFSFATGSSTTYAQLFFARLLNGGCMSGSVPVAFSLLGDLFATEERNAASSGLTAMMGLGIFLGQVYAGVVGSSEGWSHAFYVSSMVSLFSAALVQWLVTEPVRGGKEEVLQDMLRHGTRYERKLTWEGFVHAMHHCESNVILMWQGFFSSVPWGIMFVFLNDYLSQERGFTVPDATYLVFLFGIGCALGGILGGWAGQIVQSWDRSYLPIFMAVTTFLGIIPFLWMLNGSWTNAHGYTAWTCSLLGGCIASLPSVNVRPCLINVNPPETRGAALTAANLIVNLARGIGPSCITLMATVWGVNRTFSFNVTLVFFWSVASIQLLYLAKSLPRDQDRMETELAAYAASEIEKAGGGALAEDDSTIVSIEDRMTSFDAGAARESIHFVGVALREMQDEVRHLRPLHRCSAEHISEASDESSGDDEDMQDIERKRELWRIQQEQQQQEHTWNSYQHGGNVEVAGDNSFDEKEEVNQINLPLL